MGCCQSSTVSNSDQVTVELSKEHLNKQDSMIDTIQVSYIPDIQLLRFENQKTSTPSSPDTFNYSLGAKIVTNSIINRYSCIQSQSGLIKEALIIKKSALFQTDCKKLIENSVKLSQFPSENLIKVLFVSEDRDYVKIVTDHCGNKSLDEVAQDNKIPFSPALTFIKQIMQGVMQFHKLGIILKHLTEKDVFLVNNSVKISISATIQKMSEFDPPDFEVNPKNDVWSLGVIFIKLLLAPSPVKSIQDGIERLELLKLHQDDIINIKNFFKPLFQRPSLNEVFQYRWQSSTLVSTEYQNKNKNYVIEKISEELSENYSFEENQSARIDKSEGSSNEFYQSEELEEAQDEDAYYNNDEWQEVDVNQGKIRVCEILNDEMKEIIESIPDHEVSSIENQSHDKSLPCSPAVTSLMDTPKTILIIPEMEAKLEELSSFESLLPLSNSFLECRDREGRGDWNGIDRKFTLKEEKGNEFEGNVKYFSMKKRAGVVISCKTEQEFLISQDDLVLSKIDLKHFTKQLVSQGQVPIKFSLSPKSQKIKYITLL